MRCESVFIANAWGDAALKAVRKSLALIVSGVIVVLTAIGTYIMLTNTKEGLLVAYGLQNLKFFTVDSNLFLGLVCLAELILATASALGKIARIPPVTEGLIYVATVAVALTFTVVVLFFGPAIGYADLFQDANLYFHLIIPVLAILSFCVLRRGRRISLKETAAALIPSVLYGLYYTVVLLIRGVHFPDTDWYGFASGGIVGSVITASGILLVTWTIALLLRLASGGTKRFARHRSPTAG